MKRFYSLMLLFVALVCVPWSAKGTQINEGFEDTTFPPDGWSAIHVSGSESWQRYTSQYSSVGYNSSACAQMKYAYSGHENYLITPQLKPEAEESLTFYVKKDYSGTNLVVEVSTTTNEKSAFSELSTITDANISSTWAQKSVDLSAYVGLDIYIAFHVIDNNGSSIYLDDVAGVTLKPESCPKTSAPEASDITANSATITWTKNGSEEEWNLQYKKSSDEEWTSVNGLTSTTYELTSLSASTTYNIQVQAVCGSEDKSDWKAGSNFTTSCAAEPITWEYNFDGMTNNQTQLNICAVRYGSNYYPCAVTGVKKSGSASYYFYGGQSDNEQLLVLPEFTEELKDLKVRFFYQSNSSTYSKTISAGYVTDPNNKSTYVPKTTLENGKDAWTEVVCTYDEAPAGARFAIYFKGTNSGYNKQGKLWIDEFTVSSAIDCSQPQDVTISGITGEGAHVAWTALEGVTTYRYCIVAHGDAADWSKAQNVNTNAEDLTGLTAGTEYDFYVQGKCTGENWTEASAAVAFTPSACPTVTSVSLTTPLYNGVTVNWTSNGSATYDVGYQVVGGENWTVCAEEVEGNSKAITGLVANTEYIIAVKPHCSEAWLAAEGTYTPVYTLPGVPSVADITTSGANVSWDAATGGATGYEYVLMEGAAAADWTSPTATELTSATLSELTDGKQYTFYVRATFGEVKGDAVSKSFNTAAIAPILSSEYTADKTSATFTWTNEGSATKYQWSLDNSTWSDPFEGLTATATSLTAGTSYTFYVRAYYTETIQSASVNLPFVTECEAQAIGWSENFGTAAEVKPNCWNIANWGTSANYWTTAGDYAKTGVALRYNARTMSSSDAITPSIEITDKCQLTFYIRNSVGSNSAKVECKVLVNDGNETTEIAHITTRYTTATLQTLDLSAYVGKTVTIIFRGMGYDTSGSPYLWIDDVAVEYAPVATPTNVKAVQGNASATITWDSEETGTWSIQYRAVGAEAWTTVEGLTEKSKTLTGLTNGTEYEAQVQAVCSANRKSDWTASVNFTPEDCPTVTGVTFGAKTYNSVVVNWETSGAGTWNLQYTTSPAAGWTKIENIAETTKTLSNLETGVVYTVQVSPTCSEVYAENTFELVYTKPAASAATAITESTANVAWTQAVDDNAGFQYSVTKRHIAPEAWTTIEELNVTLEDLEPGTEYDFFVRAKYGDAHSAADSIGFKTSVVEPTDLTASEIGVNTAKLTWKKSGIDATFEYATGEPTSLAWNPVDVKEVSLESLTANTSYTYYVRTVYSNGVKTDSVKVSFTTNCDVYALPFEQNFNGLASIPDCWDNTEGTTTTDSYKWRYNTSGHDGACVRFESYNNAMNNTNVLATPTINLDKDAVLKFWCENPKGGAFEVLIGEVGKAKRDTLLKNLTSISNWTEKEVDLSDYTGKDIVLYFCGTSNYGTGSAAAASLYLDDVTITALPSCRKPATINVTTLPDGATISWTAGHGETQFQYHVDENDWTLLNENVLEVTLHGYAQSENHDFYVRAYCSESEQSEEVHTTFAALCPAPTALDTVDGTLTTNAVSIHWTAAEGINDYQYVVLAKDAAENWTNAVKVEGATTANIEGLDASTAYDVYVRSYYSETVQSASVKKSFRTECANVTVLPWPENFEKQETDAAPACWELLNAQSSSTSTYPYIAVSSESSYAKDTKSLFFRSNANVGYAILPVFDVDLNNAQISFTHKTEKGYSGYGMLVFGYLTDIADASTFDTIKVLDYTNDWVNEVAIAIPALPTGARLAFQFKATGSYYDAAVDNITIEEKPACAVPTGLAVSEIKDVTAKVAWASDAAGFALQYKAAGDENWSDAAGEMANPFTLTGLTEHTTYSVRVKAVCGVSSESAWSDPTEFTTDWTPKAFPYEESFSSAFDGRWSVVETLNHGTNKWSIVSEGTETTNYFAQYRTTDNASNHSYLQTPEVVLPNDVEPALLFNWRNGGATVSLQISVDKAEAVDLDADLNTELSETTSEWTLKKFDLSDYKGHTVRLFFIANSGTKNLYVDLDEVRFIEKPCFLPTELAATGIDNGATVTWTAGWDETSWNLRYRVVKAEEPYNAWKVVENIVINEAQINGLTANVLHEVQVQAACNGDEWTGSVQFTPTKATGFDNIDADGKGAIKLIENDQLVIIRDGIKYNAQGKRLGE